MLSKDLQRLFRRSLLIIRSQISQISQIDNNGPILAANDFDITVFNNDTYFYMWP